MLSIGLSMRLRAAFRWTAWKRNILSLQSTIQSLQWVEAVSAPQPCRLFKSSSFTRSIYLHLCRLEPIYCPPHLSTVFNVFLPSHLVQTFAKRLPDNISRSFCSRQVIWAHSAAACGTDRSGLVSARADYLPRLLIKLSNHPNFQTVFTPT